MAEPGFAAITSMPVPVGGARLGGTYDAVSCATATQCTAVGAASGPGDLSAVTGTSDGWDKPTRLLLPSGAVRRGPAAPQLLGISCPSAGTCTAVGIVKLASGAIEPLVLTESSGAWQAPTPIAPPPSARVGASEDAWLTAVDCVVAGSCVAVGTYIGIDGLPHGLVETQASGGAFVPGELPDMLGLSVADQAFAVSVACTDATDCTAVAQQVFGNAIELDGIVWTDSAGTWSLPDELFGPTSTPSLFTPSSVACPDPVTCIIVGVVISHRGADPGYDVETSGLWAATAALPLPRLAPKADGGELSGISCDTAAVCEAVGSFAAPPRSGLDVAGAATWSNGSWSTIDYVRAAPGGATRPNLSGFTGVSCVSTSTCTAVGTATHVGRNGPGPSSAFSTTLDPVRAVISPSTPVGVDATGRIGGVAVRWLPPTDDGGSPILSFTAAVLPLGRRCTTDDDGCVMRGLRNGRRYRVDVIDRTAFGASHVTTTTFVAGQRPSRPGQPRASLVAGSLLVTWRPSRTPAGEPVRYRVTVRGLHRFSRAVRSARARIVLPISEPGPYSVAVMAINASGTSSRRSAHVLS